MVDSANCEDGWRNRQIDDLEHVYFQLAGGAEERPDPEGIQENRELHNPVHCSVLERRADAYDVNIAKHLFSGTIGAVIIAEEVNGVAIGGERFGSLLDAFLSRKFTLEDQTHIHRCPPPCGTPDLESCAMLLSGIRPSRDSGKTAIHS